MGMGRWFFAMALVALIGCDGSPLVGEGATLDSPQLGADAGTFDLESMDESPAHVPPLEPLTHRFWEASEKNFLLE